MIPGGDH